ncbi:hypothetical protein UFOVP49_38 [uncultured Caudovirales phage]|uniref:Uncharacterized protein n=1 Tax=uncultured Caudovirales phage TaxID=2100421 RepID=A0A6J5KSC4_9CAUD|nr:hypothetical protein UFOVP49_38 [uncultured Caudovirales phage]
MSITLSFTILILTLVVIGLFTGQTTFTRYVSLGFDVFCNVLTGGKLGVTISARAGVAEIEGELWGKVLSRLLNLLEPNHCQLAIQGDIDRARAIINKLTPYDKRI